MQHELPGVWFSEREIHALLTMHQLIQGLDEGGLLSRHLQPLLEKLQGMLGPDDKQAHSLMRRVRIVIPALDGRGCPEDTRVESVSGGEAP